MPPARPLTVTACERIADLPRAWDSLDPGRSPFMERGFLEALEASGSVGPGTGWQPLFLLAHDPDGTLLGAVPAFVKTHSYGEYIFDWGWAKGAQAAGIPYYPKLVVAAPFTPATGRRLLLRSASEGSEEQAGVAEALARATIGLARQLQLSSVHFLFITEDEERLLVDAGFQARLTTQYHWEDEGYGDFEGFLGSLRSKRRREIRRERRSVEEAGVSVRMIPGAEMEDRHWEAADAFYRHTCDRKWNDAYLQPGFFDEIRRRMPERFVFCAAELSGEVIAGAIFFRRQDALYGRHWGRRDMARLDGLHFEVCYYAPLEWALQQGVRLVEAGAQGEHKVARGFRPASIRSAHYFADPRLAGGVARFLDEERAHTELVMEHLERHGAFRREEG